MLYSAKPRAEQYIDCPVRKQTKSMLTVSLTDLASLNSRAVHQDFCLARLAFFKKLNKSDKT